MKKTGEILKKAREEKGLSLNEVGLNLKISSKVLKAIEEGDEKNLPAKTFLRGFVKSYATFLRLDSAKVLESFYEEYGSTRPQPYIRPVSETGKESSEVEETPAANEPAEEASTTKETASSREASVTPIRQATRATPPPSKANPYNPLNEKKNTKAIIIGVVGAILLCLILFTKKMIDKYTKEAEVPTAQIEKAMDGATPVANTEAPVEAINPEPSPEAPLSGISKPQSNPAPVTMVAPKPSPVVTSHS
ncbi:MAG TPA: helix-turn-helix transcriptional regulator, partial [Bdellovibrio sp.]|nr:helix-turn-helix transcriptional regulator [Bdellovibrio sp.]